ncbi:hypothetical protein H8356DRAFT_1068574 [Neocallimastix lanati (nom. inval.)]|nr:hypothetical protein H8356DRAFT_1068574 [Neocallimastix sp. JGI-2020a]
MNYETFEIKLFENLKNKNSKCLKEIENNKEIIKSNLGENGEPEILEGFITKLSSVILQANSKKIFSLIEDVLLHPCFSRKNDDLVNCLTNSSSSQSSSSSSSSVKNKNENENIMHFKGNPNLEYKETIKNLLPYMGNRYSEHPLDPKTMKRLKHIYEEKIGKLNESTNNNEYRFGPRDSRQAVLQLSVALTLIL